MDIPNIQAENLQHDNTPEVLYKKREVVKETARGYELEDQ